MPLIADRKSRPDAPAGTYIGRCIDVFSAGWWKDQNDYWVEKCKIRFITDAVDESGKPLMIDWFGTLSLGKKATLTALLESWRSKQFTKEELDGFDLERLLDVPVMIAVVPHTKQDGTSTTKIGSLTPVHKSVPQGEIPKAPRDYIMDRDSDKPFATEHQKPATPPRAGSAAAKPASAAKPPAPAELPPPIEEDDDLPF